MKPLFWYIIAKITFYAVIIIPTVVFAKLVVKFIKPFWIEILTILP